MKLNDNNEISLSAGINLFMEASSIMEIYPATPNWQLVIEVFQTLNGVAEHSCS